MKRYLLFAIISLSAFSALAREVDCEARIAITGNDFQYNVACRSLSLRIWNTTYSFVPDGEQMMTQINLLNSKYNSSNEKCDSNQLWALLSALAKNEKIALDGRKILGETLYADFSKLAQALKRSSGWKVCNPEVAMACTVIADSHLVENYQAKSTYSVSENDMIDLLEAFSGKATASKVGEIEISDLKLKIQNYRSVQQQIALATDAATHLKTVELPAALYAYLDAILPPEDEKNKATYPNLDKP